jgi:hypothetical protein
VFPKRGYAGPLGSVGNLSGFHELSEGVSIFLSFLKCSPEYSINMMSPLKVSRDQDKTSAFEMFYLKIKKNFCHKNFFQTHKTKKIEINYKLMTYFLQKA